MRILIPARKNSKGLPFKNRKLFADTAKIIPREFQSQSFVFTDDEVIKELAQDYKFKIPTRNPNSARDEATTKELMQDFCSNFDNDDTILMLYLTYPERTWSDVLKAIDLFNNLNLKSLLCKKEVKQSPYLMMYELKNNRGQQIIEHDFSRRQDYKPCFEISHFISIIKQSELPNLNNNLYNQDTYFMKIRDVLDID